MNRKTKKAPRLFIRLVGLFGALALTMLLPLGRAAADGEVPFGAGSVITTTADHAISVYAADVDGDGDMDVLSASYGDNMVAWHENDGGSPPEFTSHVITTDAEAARSVYAADVDGDGDMDVLCASPYDDTIAWYESNGGTPPAFTPHVITTSANGAYLVHAADVDGDGDIDVLSASWLDDTIAWYENDGESPPDFTSHIIATNADRATSVYAADVDGDGDVDVLSSSELDNKIAWYENDGGSPPVFTDHIITTSANGAYSVYAADIDGDGDLDALSASYGDDTIAWYENDGGSPPGFTNHTVVTNADAARSVYATDVDGDGDVDVLSASLDDDKIAWYENDGSSPPAFTDHVITTSADGARWVHAVDVDSDGDTDVLSASELDNKIAWYPNHTIHRSALYPLQACATITDTAAGATSVYAADVDGDGDVDVLSASRDDDKIAWYENDGGSPPAFTSHVITTTADDTYSVYAVDVDGDGDVDVLSASPYDNKIAWYENDDASPPTFSSRVITTTANSARSVYAADVDGDGDVDVLSASRDDDKIAWYENDGGSPPAFTSHVIVTNADGAWSVYATDVDGDGDVDVLSASRYDDKIAWYENDGGSPPAFTGRIITTSADGATSVYAADMDGDGDVDVLSASFSDDKIAWYENDGGSPPAFTDHVIAATANSPRSVYAADMDRDSDLDVLSASADDDKIAWYENRGGQFALTTTDTAPAEIDAGEQDDILRVVATHRGRAGDTDVELVTFELLFEESAGDPLTTAEANNLIENLYVYRDNGSGSFEPGADTLVATIGTLSLAAGTQTVVFADGDSDVRVVFGTPVTYFVVVELTGDAADQTPNQFRVTHVTDPESLGSSSRSTAEDRDHDLPLVLEFAPNVASSICTASGLQAPELYPISNPDGDGDYVVDWSDVSGATGYTLEEDDNASFSSPTIRYSGANSQYTVSDQPPGTYYYRVRAFNAAGESPWSDPPQSTTVAQPPPQAPSLFAIDNPDGDGDYVVDWSDVSRATGYTLEEDDNDSFSSPTTRYSGANSQYIVSGQSSGTWYYRVRASNAGGDSPWSNTQPVTVPHQIPPEYWVYLPLVLRGWPPLPDVPTLYAISNPEGDGSYTVSWSTANYATSYVLEEARISDFSDAVEVYSGASTSHAVSGRGAARYTYRVKARNSLGDSDWSYAQSVDVLWEAEPNDKAQTQANGPVVSGLIYYGAFPGASDPKDYFYFDLPAAHTVEVWLSNIPAGHNYDLTLRDASLNVVGHSGELRNADEHILTGALPPGRYYIQVTNASQTGSTQAYHLQVVYQ